MEGEDSGVYFTYFMFGTVSFTAILSTLFCLRSKERSLCVCKRCIRKAKPTSYTKFVIPAVSWMFVILAHCFIRVPPKLKGYDPYSVLGIDVGSPLKDITDAYKKLVFVYHPDTVNDDEKEAATERFREIQTAYSTLTDQKMRENYEKYGDPNGPTVRKFGVAFPKWITSTKHGFFLVFLYSLIVGGALPYIVLKHWNSQRNEAAGVSNGTSERFSELLTQKTTKEELISILLNSEEYVRLYFEDPFLAEVVRERTAAALCQFGIVIPAMSCNRECKVSILTSGKNQEKLADDTKPVEVKVCKNHGPLLFARTLFVAHLSRHCIDLNSKLMARFQELTIKLIEVQIRYSFSSDFTHTAELALSLHQRFVQASSSDEYTVQLSAQPVRTATKSLREIVTTDKEKASALITGLKPEETEEALSIANSLPLIKTVTTRVFVGDVEAAYSDSWLTVRVTLNRPEKALLHAPYLLYEVKNIWYVYLVSGKALVAGPKLVEEFKGEVNVDLGFRSRGPGTAQLCVCVRSSCYLGLDVVVPTNIRIVDAPRAEEERAHEFSSDE